MSRVEKVKLELTRFFPALPLIMGQRGYVGRSCRGRSSQHLPVDPFHLMFIKGAADDVD